MSLFTFTSKSSAELPFDAGLLYEILTDYDGYAEWNAAVAQSKLLASEGDLAIAEFELSHPKGDKYAFECIHTRDKMVLTRRISGKAPVTQVEWTLAPSGSGSTRVDVEIHGRSAIRKILGGYAKFASPQLWLKALQAHASSFSGGVSAEDESGEKIFEIVETGDGLVCWFRGKRYILQPAPEGKQ